MPRISWADRQLECGVLHGHRERCVGTGLEAQVERSLNDRRTEDGQLSNRAIDGIGTGDSHPRIGAVARWQIDVDVADRGNGLAGRVDLQLKCTAEFQPRDARLTGIQNQVKYSDGTRVADVQYALVDPCRNECPTLDALASGQFEVDVSCGDAQRGPIDTQRELPRELQVVYHIQHSAKAKSKARFNAILRLPGGVDLQEQVAVQFELLIRDVTLHGDLADKIALLPESEMARLNRESGFKQGGFQQIDIASKGQTDHGLGRLRRDMQAELSVADREVAEGDLVGRQAQHATAVALDCAADLKAAHIERQRNGPIDPQLEHALVLDQFESGIGDDDRTQGQLFALSDSGELGQLAERRKGDGEGK